MKGFSNFAGKWSKAGMAALAAAALAIPAASAFAVAPDAAPVAEVAAEATAEATAEAVAETALTAEQMDAGRALFVQGSCGSCHALGDAGGAGHIGPALDGNDRMDKAFVVSRIADGQGAMPSFGWMNPEDIDLLAAYIVQAKK